MGYNFKDYNPDQLFLLPPSLDEWLPQDHLARFVSATVDHMEAMGSLDDFYARYREDGWGRAAYHPKMMVKVLVYGYCAGVTSSRKLAKAVIEDVPMRFLAANQRPDFRTLSDFRKDHMRALEGLFTEVLTLCQASGLGKLGRVALDGRRVQGNASMAANRDRKTLKKEVRRLMNQAKKEDRDDDQRFGPDKQGDELPEDLASDERRLKKLQEAQAALDEREKDAGKDKKVNLSDADSRLLKTSKGWVQGYNGQAAADCESQVIMSQWISQAENDRQELEPLLEHCPSQAGLLPLEVVADAGYWSEANAELGEDHDIELFIATKQDRQTRAEQASSPFPRGPIPQDATAVDLMTRKLKTKKGREAYRQRGCTIEPIFGQMAMRGLTRFLLRGKEKVAMEWSLWCATHNLLKLWRSGWQPSLSVA